MQYVVKQKIFTFFKNEFEIYNQDGKLEFHVESNILPPYKLYFKDENGNLIMIIKKRYFRILKRYDMVIDKKFVAKVKTKPTVFTKRFKVKSKNEKLNDIKIDGDILGFNFNFVKDGKLLAGVNKKFLTVGDKYKIDIEDIENKEFHLALAVIIDEIVHKKRKA